MSVVDDVVGVAAGEEKPGATEQVTQPLDPAALNLLLSPPM